MMIGQIQFKVQSWLYMAPSHRSGHGWASSGQLNLDTHRERDCLRMRGDVSTANNGGFVQMALSLSDEDNFDASAFIGIILEVAGE